MQPLPLSLQLQLKMLTLQSTQDFHNASIHSSQRSRQQVSSSVISLATTRCCDVFEVGFSQLDVSGRMTLRVTTDTSITDDQLLFECTSMSCQETIQMPQEAAEEYEQQYRPRMQLDAIFPRNGPGDLRTIPFRSFLNTRCVLYPVHPLT